MSIATLPDLLREARAHGVGVGAFNVILIEHAEALVAAAELAEAPVILQISQNCVAYHGGLKPIAAACLSIAADAGVPVGVHLDHAEDEDLVKEAVRIGVPSVMFDASKDPYTGNVARTRAVVDFCHTHDVAVEAELGEVGGKDGVHAPGARTDPGEAREFVEATGVDALAVAVGTSHARAQRDLAIDLELVSRLSEHVDVPLVLHGSSSLNDDQLRRAVGRGITKVNVATHLNGLFTAAIRAELASNPSLTDPRKYLAPAREAMQREAARLLRVLRDPVMGEPLHV